MFSPVRFCASAVLLVLALGGAEAAVVPAPPPPAQYKVVLRYSIRAGRNERLAQYFALVRHLEALGFQKDPGPLNEPEDPDHVRMTGTIASVNARKLLLDRHVKALLLMPAGWEMPMDPDAPVKVQIGLSGSLPPDRQSQLAGQTAAALSQQGFREAVGYDHRGHTRLVGTLPAGRLERVLEDLRWQGSGWLAPQVPVADLPLPLRSGWPLVVVEVTPEPEGVQPVKELAAPQLPPADQPHLLKLTPDLQALLAQGGQADRPLRLELILAAVPTTADLNWARGLVSAAPGLHIEGRIGPLITVLARPDLVPLLAALPNVSVVRLPRPALAQVQTAPQRAPGSSRSALEASGLERLHKMGNRGRGVRMVIVAGDFRGWDKALGKGLSAGTRLVDLTAERNPDLHPDPMPDDGKTVGSGTLCAQAAALAAPEAELTLVRIDPAAPYMLETVARYINGESFRSISLEDRNTELTADLERLAREREALLQERQVVLNNFAQDEATTKRRAAYFKRQAEYDQEEAAYRQRQARYLKLLRDLESLKGVRVVACPLVWNEGYPVDGSSPLSRYFDDRPFRAAKWFQAAGDVRGQTWAGLFRDTDRNGVLEFTPPEMPLPAGRWTRELNFLGWQQADGKVAPELPAKTSVRVAVQWREAHDPQYSRRGEDLYRVPLAYVQLVVLRQRDPSGKQLPADDLEVVARSFGIPQRLDNQPGSATYEQTVEFTVETPGRYALRVEGRPATGRVPPGVPTLPASDQSFEFRPRLFVNTLADPAQDGGRAVFLDFPTDLGSIGMPADAHRALSVGAADLAGKRQPYSAGGPPANMELLRKPDLLAYDELPLGSAVRGTGVAAAFAAGMTATAFSAGVSPAHFLPLLHVQPGGLLLVAPERAAQR